MARYLTRLEGELAGRGFAGALFAMLSGGGITTLETAIRFPVRLVESGPAGGAIFASHVAAAAGLDAVLSLDMGGTTAKICLIDGGRPQTARAFEVARVYRFMKGSGLPLRIPVIEMVEIGAGGGSIATIDAMRRIAVGPESAGSEPGPACYGRGGEMPTVTDADLVMGRIDAGHFSGGRLALDADASNKTLAAAIGAPLGLTVEMAAFGVGEMVDENMANAVRVHAIESGKTVGERTLVAFGGAAPLHAARIAEKLEIDRVVIPNNAGVGSAVGFLRAPVAYEVVRGNYQRLGAFDTAAVNAMFEAMRTEAHDVVERGAPGVPRDETRIGFMRYLGQGHEIAVTLPVRPLGAADTDVIRAAFERTYEVVYGRIIPGVDIEVLSWVITVGTPTETPALTAATAATAAPEAAGERALFDPASGATVTAPVYWRGALAPGARIAGPAVIAEDETSTIVSPAFDAAIDGRGYIVLTRK